MENEKQIAQAREWFPKNEFALARQVLKPADIEALLPLCKKTGLRGVAVLDSCDDALVSKAKSAGCQVGVWPKSGKALSAAVSSKRIDFVFQPVSADKPFFDLQSFRVAHENGIEILLVLDSYGSAPPRILPALIKNTHQLGVLAHKAKCGVRVVSGAQTIQGLRSISDLAQVKEWFVKSSGRKK